MAQRGTISLDQIRGAPAGGFPQSLAATGSKFIEAYDASTGLFTARRPTEADLSISDITTNNVSTSAHGLAPKLPNDATKFLDGTGAYSVPSGGGGGGGTGMGTAFTVPPTTSWTNVNISAGSVVTSSAVSMNVQIEDNASLNWRFIKRPISGDFTLVVFWRSLQFGTDSQSSGIYLTDGTKFMGLEYLTQNSTQWWRVQKLTNFNTASTTLASLPASNWCGPAFGGAWARVRKISGTIYFDLGQDGATWWNMTSEAVGTFITPTDVAFGGISVTNSTRFVQACLLSWNGVS